jgi:hypothetical protein
MANVPERFEKLIDQGSIDAVIKLRCNDAGHARGKIRKIETFVRVDGYWRPWPRAVATIGHLPDYGAPAPTSATLHDYRRPDGSTRRRYQCDMCEARRPRGQAPLECTEETLQWLLNTVAAQGWKRISIHESNVIVSNRPKQ